MDDCKKTSPRIVLDITESFSEKMKKVFPWGQRSRILLTLIYELVRIVEEDEEARSLLLMDKADIEIKIRRKDGES